MGLLTAFMFLAEVRGYSKLYDGKDSEAHGGLPFMALSFVTFMLFTDCLIYWIHRGLHAKSLYFLHKLHHKWKVSWRYIVQFNLFPIAFFLTASDFWFYQT